MEPTWTEDERKDVAFRVEEDGLDYAFRCYSDYSNIKDTKFHELRAAYIKAAEELEAYVGSYDDPETQEEE